MSIQLVKLMLRQSDTTAYQRAAALRYAALKQIPHDALAEELAKKGNGIAEWADRFSKEFGTKKRAASGLSDPPGIGAGDDDAEVDDANYDDGDDLADDDSDDHCDDMEEDEEDEGDEDDAISHYPDVDWRPNALRKWRETKVNGGTWLFIKKRSENRARIMKKSRPK